jgi:ectoine hydroxylase-related dioxygenase (phytanoyl-CoA dioxygenase family)
LPGLRSLLGPDGVVGSLVNRVAGSRCGPVRAILFDKSPAMNWALGWHQDRTIVVTERVDLPGYTTWSTKAGLIHVEPPFPLLERMLTLRVHLDDVGAGNAPLLVAPGSHKFGRIAEADVKSVVARCGSAACLARRGDIWVYSTPVLHASEAAARPVRRRVLQVDYSSDELPAGLTWKGI